MQHLYMPSPVTYAHLHDPAVWRLSRCIRDSHHHLLGIPLEITDDPQDPQRAAQLLYEAPLPILAHDGSDDPRFIYANLAAQQRFAYDWQQFIGLPSRLSAPTDLREERQRLLDDVLRQGWSDGYQGIRVRSDGRLFRISGARVWNLLDADGRRSGQAASIAASHDL
jgi:PAS domain-containing protein